MKKNKLICFLIPILLTSCSSELNKFKKSMEQHLSDRLFINYTDCTVEYTDLSGYQNTRYGNYTCHFVWSEINDSFICHGVDGPDVNILNIVQSDMQRFALLSKNDLLNDGSNFNFNTNYLATFEYRSMKFEYNPRTCLLTHLSAFDEEDEAFRFSFNVIWREAD